MIIPKNHEKLQTIAEIFEADIEKHLIAGGGFADDTAVAMARDAIRTCMPELADLQGKKINLGAEIGYGELSAEGGGLYVEPTFEAVFDRIWIGSVDYSEKIDESVFCYSKYPLCVVMRERFVNPDPIGIIDEKRLYIPLHAVGEFEPLCQR